MEGLERIQATEGTEVAERLINRFLSDVVVPFSAFLEGHFVSGRKHLHYLFDIRRIAEQFSEDVLQIIQTDVKRAIESQEHARTIAYIVYPEFNPGLQILASTC